MYLNDIFTVPVNLSGLPAISIPAGKDKNNYPLGLQLIGKAFEEKYEEYEKKAQAGEMDQFKSVPAKELWRKMLTMLFETGHPWITLKIHVI